MYKYEKFLKEKELKLKKLLEKLSFHTLIEILEFSEIAQNIKISIIDLKLTDLIEEKGDKNGVAFLKSSQELRSKFYRNAEIILITQQYDEKLKKLKTIIYKSYIKSIFGYFKNDKFRKPFQIIRSFLIIKRATKYDNKIDITKLFPYNNKKRYPLFSFSFNNYSGEKYTNFIFNPNPNIRIKKIKFHHSKLIISKNKLNDFLELVECEDFTSSIPNSNFNNYNDMDEYSIDLSSGLKNIKNLSINKKFNIENNDFLKFSSNFIKLKFYRMKIEKSKLDLLYLSCKNLKSLNLSECEVKLLEVLKYLKESKIKKFISNKILKNIEVTELKNLKNIDDYKNSTLENLEIVNDNLDFIPIINSLFSNLKEVLIKSYEEDEIKQKTLNIAKLNLEYINIPLVSFEFFSELFKIKDKKKLKKLYITNVNSNDDVEKFNDIENFPKLTSFFIELRYDNFYDFKRTIRKIGFLNFFQNCNIREFTFYIFMYEKEKNDDDTKESLQMLFDSFNLNPYMYYLEINSFNFTESTDNIIFFRK